VTARFHAPDAAAPGTVVTLPADEGAHLTRVLRLGRGDPVRVFDGRGGEFDAVVERTGRRDVQVRIEARRPSAPERATAVTLCLAVLKGDRMDDAVRDAAMLGAAAIQPVVSTHAAATLASLSGGARRERWTRTAVAGAKQSGRAVVPPIREPVMLADCLAAIGSAGLPAPAWMFVEPQAGAGVPLSGVTRHAPAHATIVVGPEGGWTTDEVAAGRQACALITMRGPTLRADVMPVVALTALFTLWESW
jgi:16S rRNA (uracil1498-N3)-methyltransferase